MKKKILCALLAAITLLSCFALAVSAEDEQTPSVMTDLSALEIDGVPFSKENYPRDTSDPDFYIITVIESHFVSKDNSPDYDLFIYIYNPSGQDIADVQWNAIQVGFNDQCKEYSYVGLKLLSKSSDDRFIKAKVVSSQMYDSKDCCVINHESNDMRIYNIASLRLKVKRGNVRKVVGVKKAFIFSGFNSDQTLTCISKSFDALDVELHATNWISPNAGLRTDGTVASIYDHYEINSVFFKVPKSYWNKYEYLKSIRARYDAIHLTPIILTRVNDMDFSDAKGQATKQAILNGTTIEAGGTPDVYDLYWAVYWNDYVENQPISSMHSSIYSENGTTRRDAATYATSIMGVPASIPLDCTVYESLAYYFACLPSNFSYTDGESVVEAAVSSEELEEYFYQRYYNPYYDDSKLYDEKISNISLDYYSTDYDADALYNMTTFSSALANTSKLNQWWRKFTTENDSYLYEDFETTANHIDVVQNPLQYVSVQPSGYKDVAAALHIGVNDVADFSRVCQEAVQEDCYVVLLRFGFSDYRCQVVRDVWEYAIRNGPLVGLAVDKWAFMDFSVAHLVFYNDGEDYTIPVVSNVVDSFGDLSAYGDPNMNGVEDWVDEIGDSIRDLFEKSKDIWKKILMIALAVLVVLVAVWIFFKLKPVRIKYKQSRSRRRRR